MTTLILGLVIFLGAHSISIVAGGWRDRTAARLGEQVWQGIYSLVAVAGFALIVWGFGLARQEPSILYLPPVWTRHLALLLMVPVFPLLLAAYFPGRIRTATKHPMLLATLLWAFSHLLANGMLGEVVLFGAFLVWAAADLASMRGRVQRPLPGAPPSRANDAIALGMGLALYGILVVGLHRWLIGVPVV